MKVRMLFEAEAELDDAIAHYEFTEPGLGIRLKDEAKVVTSWISRNPEVPALRRNGHRRVNFKVFPYFVAYTIHNEIIWILCFAHAARHPEYWVARRLPEN